MIKAPSVVVGRMITKQDYSANRTSSAISVLRFDKDETRNTAPAQTLVDGRTGLAQDFDQRNAFPRFGGLRVVASRVLTAPSCKLVTFPFNTLRALIFMMNLIKSRHSRVVRLSLTR